MDLIDRVIAREGGAKVTNDPNDAGGLTKYGISARAHPGVDIANLTYEHAKDIYIREYWVAPGFQQLPAVLQAVCLDWGVHSGPPVPVEALQRLVGVSVDGRIGPATLAALSSFPSQKLDELASALTLQRVMYLTRNAIARPQNLKFLVGWLTRALTVV